MMEQDPSGMNGVLVICNGGFEGMEYELRSEETLIGRNPTTDVTLLDENISREHSIIVFDPEDNSYTIEDLQSTNGTKVNGKKIRSSDLSDADEIEIGHTRFRFMIRQP
jgi:pSer/pThr/pTyr-binding forkhead associated (FHA) protein